MVIMYADDITSSIKNSVYETNRRRNIQMEYNKVHKITPKTIIKNVSDILYTSGITSSKKGRDGLKVKDRQLDYSEEKLLNMDPSKIAGILSGLEEEMSLAARELDFEKAAVIRDKIKDIKNITSIEL